jgi:hypothetical protein
MWDHTNEEEGILLQLLLRSADFTGFISETQTQQSDHALDSLWTQTRPALRID